jgi:pantetheine-phosphate adenylyltransferase
MKIAVYPGSFDPITLGHLDVIWRSLEVFDQVIVAVSVNARKSPLLPIATRLDVVSRALAGFGPHPEGRLSVESFEGLTVEFCRGRGAAFIVRGLRTISDFDTEIQLAHTNRRLAPDVETVFFMTSLERSFISSSLAREIAQFGGDVDALVPPVAAEALRRAFGRA